MARPDSLRDEVVRHFSHRRADTAVAIPAEERYSSEDLRDLPEEAVSCSDGCGNPLLYTDIRPGDRVLDLGSGAGLDLLLAARRTGPQGSVVGVDMTGSMIELARSNARRAGLANIEVREGLIEKLPVESESIDWVISNCVINLSPEKAKVWAEIVRVLKPKGRLLISDTLVAHVPEWQRWLSARVNGLVEVLLDEESYLRTMRASGLASIEIKERTQFTGPRLRKMLAAEVGRFQRRDPRGAKKAVAAAERLLLSPMLLVGEKMLADKVSSIKVFAQKP